MEEYYIGLGLLIIPLIVVIIQISTNWRYERKKQYSNLLLILYELKFFIMRCETYLDFGKKGQIPFNRFTINNKLNYLEPLQIFNLNSSNSISLMYKRAQETEEAFNNMNEEKIVKQKNGKVAFSEQYIRFLNFIRYYLERDNYGRFNFISREVMGLSNSYLIFKKELRPYTKDYIDKKLKELSLNG